MGSNEEAGVVLWGSLSVVALGCLWPDVFRDNKLTALCSASQPKNRRVLFQRSNTPRSPSPMGVRPSYLAIRGDGWLQDAVECLSDPI